MAALFVIPAVGQATPRSTGRKLQVTRFQIAPSVAFPETWVDTMMAETVDELTRIKKFDEISLITNAATPSSRGVNLALTGTVTKFQPGSKAARFWIGMGAGKTKVVAAIKLVDLATGKVLLERDVDGSVIKGNWGGGDSSGATRGVAVEIAKRTKALFP
ncbi:MAG: DUF4410 domain-containing protein [Pyrinomonadaceae bacterium]